MRLAPTAITRVLTDGTLQVSFTAEAPTTSAGDFFFDVVHLAGHGPLIRARATATAARQADPNRYLIELDGDPLSATDRIVIRVTDPLGRSTDSTPVTVAEPPDLVGLKVDRDKAVQ